MPGSSGSRETGSWRSTSPPRRTSSTDGSSTRSGSSFASEPSPRRTSASSSRRVRRPKQARTTAEEMSDREWAILSAGVLGRLEFARGDLDAALGHVRELPGELLSKGYKDPTAPVWGDAIEILIAGGELEQASGYLDAVRGELEPCRKPVGGCRRRALPWPPCSRRGRPGCRRYGIRAISRRARGAAVSVRARPHAALPRDGASTGPAEEGRPRGAGGGARHLRGARRSPLGGEGPCRAGAHQWQAHDLGRADRDGAAGRRARRRAGTPTRRSPPSSSWE